MPIDTSIAMGYRPIAIQNPMNQLAQIMEIRRAQQQQQLGAITMQQHQSTLDDRNKLNALYSGAMNPDGTINREKLLQGAASQNLGSQIPAIQKSLFESDEAQSKVNKQKVELIDSKMKQSRAFLDNVQTPEDYMAWHEANHRDPVLGPMLAARGITAEQSRAKIVQALQQPGGLQQLITESKLGAEKFIEQNKPTLTKMDTGGEERIYSTPGLGGAPTIIAQATKVQSPDSKAREARLAEEGRLNRNQQDNSKPPVAVVDPTTGQPVYVSREEALSKRMTPSTAMLGITPKEIQAREAKYPATTAAFTGVAADSVQLEKDLLKLKEHPGLAGITGVIYGRTPSATPASLEAQALMDKIMARGGFSELAKMRAASPTGGALGNVSDTEGRYLRAAFGALSPTQSTASFQKAIDGAVTELQGSRGRLKDAYDSTYEYRAGRGATAAPAAPAAASGWGKAVAE